MDSINIFQFDLNGKVYGFSVGGFLSTACYSKSDFVKPFYHETWDAYNDAVKVASSGEGIFDINENTGSYSALSTPHKTDITGEEYFLDFYGGLYKFISDDKTSLDDIELDPRRKEEIEKGIANKIKLSINGLQKFLNDINQEELNKKDEYIKEANDLLEKFTNLQYDDPDIDPSVQANNKIKLIKTASMPTKILEDLLESYGKSICEYLSTYHDNLIFEIENRKINISSLNCGKNCKDLIIELIFSKEGILKRIIPSISQSQITPPNHFAFYQRYWKPIVELIGGILIEDRYLLGIRDLALPSIIKNKNSRMPFKAWDTREDKYVSGKLNLSKFESIEQWALKVASIDDKTVSEFNESELYSNGGALMRCTEPSLENLYNKVGVIEQIIPEEGQGAFYDINFGHHIVRMHEKSLEKVDGLRDNKV